MYMDGRRKKKEDGRRRKKKAELGIDTLRRGMKG